MACAFLFTHKEYKRKLLTIHFTIVKHGAVSGEIGFMLTKFQTPLKKSRVGVFTALYSPHQLSNRCPQRFGDGLNCKKTRILDASFNSAQKSPVNVGFGGKRFLRQLFLRPEFPNLPTKLFGNVMAHLRQSCRLRWTMAVGYIQQLHLTDNRRSATIIHGQARQTPRNCL